MLVIYLKMETERVRVYDCKHCSKVFLTKSGLKRHMSGHLTVKPFKCQMCGTGFCHKSSFKRHIMKNSCTPVDMSKPQTHKLVEKLTRSQYSCPVCGVGFAHKYTFKTHMIMNMCRVLETEQNSLSGSSSIENLSQGESLTVNNSNVPKKRAESPDLGMSDKTMEEVAAHDSQETCIVCRKIFSSKADLELHVKDHLKKKSKSLTKASGIKNTSEDSAQNLLKVFSCQLCGKITKTFMGLNAHSRHCTGSVKNKCSVCDRSFTKPCLLRRHMKRHGINLHMGRVKRRKFPKSVAYIESEPPSPEILTGTNLHMKNQALSLRNETLLFGKAASTEDEASDDYDEMTVYITEEQVEERDLLECDRLDKSDHSGHIAEDPLIDHSNDDICDSSDLRFLENSQGTEEERIVQSNNSIEPAVHRVHDDFIEPVPDICSSTQKSACSSINLCSVTNISASHTTDNGCSDACSVSYNQNTESNNYLAQGSIEYSELHSSLSLSAQNENLGLDPVTITDEINLSDSSSYVQAQVESSVAEGMCQENCGNEFSVKRKEITTVYIEEDLDEEVELFEELTRTTVEKNCTSADPLMRDLFGSEKVFSEDMKPDFPDKTAEHKYSCNVCRMTFSQKNTLRKHMTEHGEKQKFKCSVCWGDFLFESDLAKHMESHEKSQQYTCNFCGLNFVKKCGLVGHLKTHLDVQSFSCDICDRTFATKTPFIKHRREHNAKKRNVLEIVNTEQENSALETQEVNRLDKLVPSAKECNNSVLSSFTVVFGLETSEGNAYDGQVARKYQCNLCERMFNGRVGLKKHLKKHDNPSVCSSAKDIKAVSFDCDVCHMQFRKRNHLARHYSIHKNYSCSVCQQTFKSKRALTFHYKEHVKDEKLLDQDMTDATDPQYPEFDKEHEPNSSDLGISIETCSKENPPEKVISVRKTFLTETDNMESKTSLSPKQHGKLVISNNQQEENILHNNQNIMPDIQQETTSFLHVQQKKQNTLVFADQLDKKVRVKDLFPEQGDDSRQIEDELHTRKFVCHTCGRTFGKKSCLSMHSHIHRGNRPFSCPMCSLTFLCEKSLNVHLYQHKKLSSPDTGKEVFRIRNVNPKKVIAKSSPPVNDASPTDSLVGGDGERKKPIRECRLAGPRLQDSDEILLACLYCNKRCLTKSALANHIKTHTEYEHFPCKLCGVTFYFEDTLLSHQKKYHNLDQTDVSHKNITESKEEHRGDIEIQSKESEIAMSSSVIDENVKLGCESEKINIAFSCSGNETKSTVGNSKPPCQEGLHLKDMPDVSKDNFTIQQNQNRLETYENNFVEGQSAIGRTMTEVADNKRKLRYACPVCGKVFLYHRMYMRHKLLRCRGTNAYTCQNLGCDRSFNRRYNLNRHMKVHFKSKLGLFSKKIVKRNLYSELKCKSKFKNKASLEYSTDSVVNEHSHNLCGMKDLKESDHEHMKECHSVSSFPDTYEFREEADDKEKGQIALKEFRVKKHEDQTLSDLREPSEKYDAAIRSTKEPKKVRDPLTINYEEQYNHISPTFGCESDEIVEKLSDDDSEGDNFMWRNKQSKKRKGYSCDVCNINLLRYQSYTNHMKLHKELNDIKCASCGECFSNEPELVMHEKTHSSELVIDDDSKHLLETKKGNTKELSPNILLNDLESSPDLRVPVSGKFTDVKATSEVVTKKETLRDLAPKSKKIRLQKSEYDCKVCGRLILHAVDFVMHLSFHRDRDELLHSHYGPSDHLYDVIQLIVQTPICNVCRKVFCICKALGLGEDQDMDMYKCDVCEMKFMVRWSLVDHMSQHGDTVKDSLMIKDMKAYLIKTRGNVNSSEDILMQKKQSEDGRFQCSICGKTTDNTSDYILHLKTHERVYSYKCSFCQKSFKKKLARDNHMRIHEKPRKDYISKDPFKLEEKQNLGSLSTKKDSDDTNFSERRHEELCKRKCMELNMVEYPRNEVDNGCVKPTEGMIGERESKETSSSEKNVSVHCEVFDNMDNIGTKQENKQNDGKNIDVSSVSNKSTRNNATESSKEAYVCPVCNESFTRYQKLLSHEKVHFEPVMYDCEKCKHFFQCKEDYDEHLKTHSSRNFSKYYGCPVCGKKMANHANFLRHCASHSPMHNSQTLASGEKDKSIENTLVLNSLDGEDNFLSADQKKEKIKPLVPSSVTDLDTELVSENKKPAELLAGIRDYKLLEAKKPDGSKEKSLHCKFCDLVFNSLVDFHKHNLIHDFTCKFCGHTFSRKSKYKMHVKRHSAKDKRCKSCWRRFLRNREFELHKKTHRIESISNKNSSAQDSREEANTSSDEVDSLSKHPVKTNLGIDENETKIKEKGYRNRTSKLVNDSLHLENKGLDYNDLKMFNLEQDPLNSNENVTILKDPGKGGTSEAGLRVQKLLDKKLHKCRVCEESFLSYAKYLAHRKVHSKDPQITCSICKHRFGIREYVEHIDDLNCMPSYSCFQCGKKYSDHQLFTDHCKEHDIMKLATPDTDPLITGNDSISCPNITEKLDCLGLDSDNVTPGNLGHLSNRNACHICHRKCESSYILNIHMEEHFKNKSFKCDICLKSLQGKQQFKRHLENHLLNSFICRICNKSFTHQYMLVSHLQKKHNLTLESAMLMVEVQDEEKHDEAVERDESVTTCNIVHGTCDVVPGVVDSFICSICSKSFSHKYKLVTHLRKGHKLELDQAKQLAAKAHFKERVNVTETEESVKF
ncbi:uncharacterized protein [Macrobrachium rosenbergii]|uniref:uncharacterized protein n=1 Tax=Macrobrachium rosenbergii TaxID=79674 RepID=UPI0034D5AD7E